MKPGGKTQDLPRAFLSVKLCYFSPLYAPDEKPMRHCGPALTGLLAIATTLGGCASKLPSQPPPRYNPTATTRSSVIYPASAQFNGVQGKVRLCFYVTPSGSVAKVRIVQTRFWTTSGKSPTARDKRALKADAVGIIKQWKFTPRRVEGKAVWGSACQWIDFTVANPTGSPGRDPDNRPVIAIGGKMRPALPIIRQQEEGGKSCLEAV